MQKPSVQAPAKDEIDVVIFGPGFGGKSSLIHIGDGEWIVIDSCIDNTSSQPAALAFFEHIGVDPAVAVRLICASHRHDDHVGGISKIVEVCKNADFACSMALSSGEFVELASVYNRNRALIQPSGSSEMYDVLSLLEKRGQIPLRVTGGLPFYNRPHLDNRFDSNSRRCLLQTLNCTCSLRRWPRFIPR